MDEKHRRDLAFAQEKLTTYENHIKMLQEDNARLADSLKMKST